MFQMENHSTEEEATKQHLGASPLKLVFRQGAQLTQDAEPICRLTFHQRQSREYALFNPCQKFKDNANSQYGLVQPKPHIVKKRITRNSVSPLIVYQVHFFAHKIRYLWPLMIVNHILCYPSCIRLYGEIILAALEEKHPADEIGKALSRAGGILTSLSNCYEKADSDFQIGLPFVFEAVNAVEKLLARANDDLASLYRHYDLTRISDQNAELLSEPMDSEAPHNEAHVESDEPLNFPPSYVSPRASSGSNEALSTPYLGFFGPGEQVSRLATRLDNILEAMPIRQRASTPDELIDKPAETYNELLEKLTAMADAAAYQAHQSPMQDQNLLPVLEKLRADMLRIRSVA